MSHRYPSFFNLSDFACLISFCRCFSRFVCASINTLFFERSTYILDDTNSYLLSAVITNDDLGLHNIALTAFLSLLDFTRPHSVLTVTVDYAEV